MCSISWGMLSSSTLAEPPPAADGASADPLLTQASAALRARRLAEVEEMRLAVEWAVAHGHPRERDPDDRSRRDPLVTPGGDGTPAVREYAIAELAMARSTHPATTRALIADALDLVHRLPLTWKVVQAGDCEPWVARKAAVISRALLSEDVAVVDAAVARAIAGHAPSTILEIARAKVIEADPETHRAEHDRIRHERYVRLSRSDEHGYRHLIARITLGDAAALDAMTDRIADILALRWAPTTTTTSSAPSPSAGSPDPSTSSSSSSSTPNRPTSSPNPRASPSSPMWPVQRGRPTTSTTSSAAWPACRRASSRPCAPAPGSSSTSPTTPSARSSPAPAASRVQVSRGSKASARSTSTSSARSSATPTSS